MQQLSQKYNRTTHDHIFVSPNTNQTSKYFQRSKNHTHETFMKGSAILSQKELNIKKRSPKRLVENKNLGNLSLRL